MSAHSDPQGHHSSSDTPERVEGALRAHRSRRHPIEDHGTPGVTATYADELQVGTISAAADQPYMVKNRQREDYAEATGGGRGRRRRKVKSPVKLTGTTWKYSIKRAFTEYGRDGCTDLAAGLTYYTVLSIFPALIAFVSLLSLVGQQNFLEDTLSELLDPSTLATAQPVIDAVTSAQGAGLGLILGILTALWTASNYVNAFSRSMNRIYEVEEGRSILKLRPLFYLITAVLIVMVAISSVLLVVSGPIAESVGNVEGLGSTAVTVFNWVKYPVLLLVFVICVALLYFATPNLRQPGIRWISAGAFVAIVVMILATIGVGFYVANFSNYSATYGALAGVIIFLLWIYIMNLVLLFGAEFDSELERGRQLQSGIEAERTIMLPPRQMKTAEKKSKKYEDLVSQGQALRLSKGETSDPDVALRR